MFAYKSIFYELCVIKRYRFQYILLNAMHINLVYVNNLYALLKIRVHFKKAYTNLYTNYAL